jgi:hypothetical protein
VSQPARPRCFYLTRAYDIDGIHGTGRVAEGTVWTDGTVSVHWLGPKPSWAQWRTLGDAVTLQGSTNTRLEWID